MIRVTKLNGELFYVNPYEIEFIEETPDTVISLKSGKKVLVSEKAQVVIHRMIAFYQLANVMPKLPADMVPDVGSETDEEDLD
jgi:flagellar protein FlbD